MNNRERILIIILTIIIAIITLFTIFILINKKNNSVSSASYSLVKEEDTDVAGNITTISNKNYSFTIKSNKITFCFKKENECITTSYKEKGNTVVIGNLKDEYLSGKFEKKETNDGLTLEKKLTDGASIKYYYSKKLG